MRLWGVDWRTIDTTWTDEQFNLMCIRYVEQQDRDKIASARAQAKSKGNVMITDDEVAGKA